MIRFIVIDYSVVIQSSFAILRSVGVNDCCITLKRIATEFTAANFLSGLQKTNTIITTRTKIYYYE